MAVYDHRTDVSEQRLYYDDVIYVAATLLIGMLSAIVTSLLGLGRRQLLWRLRHADTPVPSIHGARGRSDGQRQVNVRV